MKRKTWHIKTPVAEHDVVFTYHALTGKSVLDVDGMKFVQIPNSFRLIRARREPFRLDEEQCILAVDARGNAAIYCNRHCTGGDVDPDAAPAQTTETETQS